MYFLVIGRNGAGKSTLIKLISGQLEPSSGIVKRTHQAKMACFDQHHTDALDLKESALAHMKKTDQSGRNEQQLHNYLGSFGLGNVALIPMSRLSGGQKTRVSLAALVINEPHVLILDEPTNHLDYESIQALANGLEEYPGSVLLVSHDRVFMKNVAREFWLLANRKFVPYHNTLDAYVESIEHSLSAITTP